MKNLLRAAATVAVLAVSVAAGAQDSALTPEDVRAAGDEFDQGRKAFTAKEYEQAAEHFESADRHAPSEKTLELAIRSRDKAGQLDRAATLAAMAQTRGYKDDGLKKLAAGILKRAAADYGTITVHCDTPCDVIIGTKLVPGRASTEKTIYLSPGDYTVRAGWSDGRDASGKATVATGTPAELSFKEPPKPVEPAQTPAAAPTATSAASPPSGATPGPDQGVKPPTGWSPAVFWIGVGATAIAGGVTIWSGIDTQKHPGADTVRNACSSGASNCDSLYQDGRSRQVRTNILAGVTAGLGVVTVVIGAFATNWSGKHAHAQEKPKPATARVEPWLGLDNGATLGATGRF